ncbi:MAG: family 20 glycosylhydrolase [Planctomycetota bacterium]
MLPCYLSGVLLLAIGAGTSCAVADESPRLHWRFIGNDNPEAGSGVAELTLYLQEEVDTGPVTLYFNFGRLQADVEPGSAAAVQHVNGDLFRLAVPAGERVTRSMHVFQGAVSNVTDAPAGCYLVTLASDGTQLVEPVTLTVDLSVLEEAASAASPSASPPLAEHAFDLATMLPVVPHPAWYEASEGSIDLRGRPISCDDEYALAARLLADSIERAGAPRPSTSSEAALPTPVIHLSVDALIADGREAYTIEIDTKRDVRVVGSDAAGLFYGVQTLIALIDNRPTPAGPGAPLRLSAVSIRDAPAFPYRGVHLDVARNFHPIDTVRRLLDQMAAYKLNRFHFHLTDDEGWRLAIRGLPELTEVGGRRGHSPQFADWLPPSFGSGPAATDVPGSGFYTRKEFIDLLRYAAGRHIEVIPEIDLPGHSRAAIRAMRWRYDRLSQQETRADAEEFLLRRPDDQAVYQSVQMWNDNVVDVRLGSSLAFVEHVVADVADMYAEAGVPLKTIHFGGDEVPKGCWDASPTGEGQASLFHGFMSKCATIAEKHGCRAAGWEEVFLNEGDEQARRTTHATRGVCYAWNNIWGWGLEDAAYRLANAGVDVVLCNATHLYLDLAQSESPAEPGYYWAGTTDTEEVFHFHPFDYLSTVTLDRNGSPISDRSKQTKTRLTAEGQRHVIGMQGHLWGENLDSQQRLDYMAFPRLLALAERAWCGPEDASPTDAGDHGRSWPEFSRHLGERELPRLDRLFGGVDYRVPSVRLRAFDGRVEAQSALHGMAIRYTADGTDPTQRSMAYETPLAPDGHFRFRAFDTRGRGGQVARWRAENLPPIAH